MRINEGAVSSLAPGQPLTSLLASLFKHHHQQRKRGGIVAFFRPAKEKSIRARHDARAYSSGRLFARYAEAQC